MGGLDVGDPVPQGLAHGVLQRSRPAIDRPDFRAERLHPQDVRRLAPDVLDAHVNDARDVEQGAGRCRSHAVHPGARFGDDAALAEPAGEQDLPEGVVELVSAGVVEVLALEVEMDSVGQEIGRGTGQPPGGLEDLGPESIGPIDRRGSAAVVELELAQLRPEAGVVAGLGPCRLELIEGGDERLRHVSSPEVAVEAPAPGGVGLQQRLRYGSRTRPNVRPIEARRASPLDEESDSQRVLTGLRADRRPRPSRGGRSADRNRRRPDLNSRGHVDTDSGNLQQGLCDVPGLEASGEDDRDLASHGGRDLAGNLAAGPSGERASGGIENEAFGAGGQVRPACLDRLCGH